MTRRPLLRRKHTKRGRSGHLSPARQSGLRIAPRNRLSGPAARATSRYSGARAWWDGPCRGRGQPPRQPPRGARGRAVVDITPSGNRCAGTLGDDPLDDYDAFASVVAQPYLVTGLYGMRGLDPYPVDPDVPGPAGTGRGRAGPGQPHRPDPAVHPPSLITGHSANCNATRARWLRPAWCLPAKGPAVSGMRRPAGQGLPAGRMAHPGRDEHGG